MSSSASGQVRGQQGLREGTSRRDEERPISPVNEAQAHTDNKASTGASKPPTASVASKTSLPFNDPADKKKKKKRIFGIVRDKPFDGQIPDDYERRYPDDEFGQEMGSAARVWRVYLDEAEFNDRNMADGWRDEIDVLLVFAGLFSAVVTTFVVQTSQKLDVDYGQVSASLLTELISMQRAVGDTTPFDQVSRSKLNYDSPPQPSRVDFWVNALWFTSLSFSLITAFSAVVIKQWIQHYVSLPSGTPQERVRLHQFRYMGIQRWSVPAIIGVLPFLMHTALFLFFGGLVALLSSLQREIAWTVASIAGVTCILFIMTSLLPLSDPQCPYRTPLIDHTHTLVSIITSAVHRGISLFYYRIFPWLSLKLLDEKNPLISLYQERLKAILPQYTLTPLKEIETRAAAKIGTSIDLDAIRWLFDFSSNATVRSIALQALSGIRFEEQRKALDENIMIKELENAIKTRLSVVVSRYCKGQLEDYLTEDFVKSSLFLEVERLLRAAILIFNCEIAESTYFTRLINRLLHEMSQEIDEKRLLAYTAYAFSYCNSDIALPDPDLIQLAEGLFQMSEIYQHPAAEHPLVWQEFLLTLEEHTAVFFYQPSLDGFLRANTHLQPLLNTMMLSELTDPEKVTDGHRQVVQSIAKFAYTVAGRGLPRTMTTMIPVPSHNMSHCDLRAERGCTPHLQLWSIWMKAITSCCVVEVNLCQPALRNHLARLSDYCARYSGQSSTIIHKADFMSIRCALDDFCQKPFLKIHENAWDSQTYEEIFVLYFRLEIYYDTSTFLLNPLLELVRPENFVHKRLVRAVFASIGHVMRHPSAQTCTSSLSPIGMGAVVKIVDRVVECLREVYANKSDQALIVVFLVLHELNWIEDLLCSIKAMIEQSPPIWHWTPIRPLVYTLLEFMLAFLKHNALHPNLRYYNHFFHMKIKDSKRLEILCEMFICMVTPHPHPLGDVYMPLPEANLLLELSKRDKGVPGPWQQYLPHLFDLFNLLHADQLVSSKAWTQWEYDQYNRVAEFIDKLKKNLGIPPEELEIPKFDDAFITKQLLIERAKNLDITQDTHQVTGVKWWWAFSNHLGRLFYRWKKHSNFPTASLEDEKEEASTLV